MKKTRIIDGLKRVFIGYILLLTIIFFMQRSLLYYPNTSYNPLPYKGFSAVNHVAKDGVELTSWYAPPREDGRPVMVFFHGNAGNIASRGRVVKYQEYINAGFGLFALEYRGYGANGGDPSEEGLYQDARSAINWLQNEGVAQENIIAYGESLGTGVAMQMATEFALKAVILEAPYSSITDVAQGIYWYVPVALLLKDKFDSIDKTHLINEPILIMHGDNDQVIAISQGKKLYDRLKEEKLSEKLDLVIFKDKGHNDLPPKKMIKHISSFVNLAEIK